MNPLSILTLFCEDIREEKAGPVTLIGIMPDNIEGTTEPGVEGVPVIPKLCIYTRIHFDPAEDPVDIPGKLIFPNNEERDFNLFDAAVLKTAQQNSIAQGNPTAGAFSRIVMPNFPVLMAGRLQMVARIKGQDHITGILNMKIVPEPTASAQPSSQSLNASQT